MRRAIRLGTERDGVAGAVQLASRLPLSIPVDDLRTYEIRRRPVKPGERDLTDLGRAVAALDLQALARSRWFAGKERRPTTSSLVDAFELPGLEGAWLLAVDVAHADGSHDRYALPARAGPRGTLVEPPPDDPYWLALAELATSAGEVGGHRGTLVAESGALSAAAGSPTRALTDDQSNTSVVLDERLVVKCYRRLVLGEHPEPELLAALDRVGSRRAPRFGGSLVRHSSDGEETLACLYAFVPGEPVGWESIIVRLRDALARDDGLALRGLRDDAAELGAAAAELHADLASAFGARPATEEEAGIAAVEARARLDEALRVATGGLATSLASGSSVLQRALRHIARLAGSPVTRVHGDLHVAQFVASPRGHVVVDFEGGPGLTLEARRRWTSPLRDVACLLLSLDHVAVAAARRVPDASALERSLGWSDAARTRAIDAYATGIAGSGLELDVPLLYALEIEKECHEVIYAATVLPEWSYAPATVLPRLLDRAGQELA